MKKSWIMILILVFFFQAAGPVKAFFGSNHATRLDPATIHSFSEIDPLAQVPGSDAQSTTGPLPPPEVDAKGALFASPMAVTLSSVPAYEWHDGCGPTAAGMVFGYWDSHGYDWLIPGNASTQTSQVEEAISSSIGSQSHYSDYALPLDYSPSPLEKDKSELPTGDEHPDNSMADFMRTSQSYYSNYYGWSWFSDVRRSFLGYFDLVNPPGYTLTSTNLYYSGLWDTFRSEIDAGRPLVFLVDTDGNGSTDHFITAIGYDEVGGVKKYAALNTWDTAVHWYDFKSLGTGNRWGIYGAITFRIDHLVYMPGVMK